MPTFGPIIRVWFVVGLLRKPKFTYTRLAGGMYALLTGVNAELRFCDLSPQRACSTPLVPFFADRLQPCYTGFFRRSV